MNLILLKSFDNIIDSHILSARLEAEGIQTQLFDEHTISVNPMYSIPLGGIKLKVHEDDYDKAMKILKEIDETPITKEDGSVLECPSCSGTEFYDKYNSTQNFKELFTAIVGIFLQIFPIFSRPVYKCKKCSYEIDMKKSNLDF